MSVTDELRAELTKRGIEWRWEDERTTYWYVTIDGEEWGEWTAVEMGGYLHLSFSSGDVLTPAQAIAATLGSETCKEVYLLMATDIGDGREEVLGAYTTESAATKAISENQFGYALHHVRKWEVTS